MLKQQESSVATADMCRQRGRSSATFRKLRAKFGGLKVSDARMLKALKQVAAWKLGYSRYRPHSSLSRLTPQEFEMKSKLHTEAIKSRKQRTDSLKS